MRSLWQYTISEINKPEECHGLGAILKDLIKEKDEIELDIDNPDNVYVGISATVPWNFNDSIKNMTNIEFVELIKKYVTKFASQPCIAGGKWKMIWTINYKKTDTYSGVSLV